MIKQVSVPCSNLLDIVTVRCGHCSNLWSVNMAAAFQSLSWKNSQVINLFISKILLNFEHGSVLKTLDGGGGGGGRHNP